MMTRRILFAILFIGGTFAYGQGKYGADSIKCITNLSLYRDYYKQKAYEDAYKYWKVAYTICPASSERMYSDGISIVKNKIKTAASKEVKNAYVDTLLLVYDQRIANFGKEGYNLGRKGTDMLRYAPDRREETYQVLRKSIEMQGDLSGAAAIVSYLSVMVEMEENEADASVTEDDVVEAFTRSSAYIAKNIAKYEGQKNQEYYIKAQENIENIASPYLNCDILVKMANDNFENKKDDAGWLERTADLLDRKKCSDAPIFFKIAKKMHADNPSAVSAEKMGIMSLRNKKYSDAVDFFKQAIEMAGQGDKLADYYVELAQAQISSGSYSSARSSARKAAELRSGFGLPYILIGDMIASSSSTCSSDDQCKNKAIYWLATDYYQKAKSIDASVAETANQKIATYKKYYPTKEDCFFGGTKEGDSVEIGCWIGESTKARFD